MTAQDNYYGLSNSISTEAEVSILAASPSAEAMYTVYGHAGLRVKDTDNAIDITFNYGIFDFNDDFFFRFVSGQTDYLVVPIHTSDYKREYLSRGSQITETKLNLNAESKAYLWRYLLNNIEPKNRKYRYNFFYDNCSIRLLKVVKEAIEQGSKNRIKLVLDASKLEKEYPQSTWRKEINSLEASKPWLMLGTDIALGSKTDEELSFEQRCFLPSYLSIVLPNYHQVSTDKEGQLHSEPLVQSIEVFGSENRIEEEANFSFLQYIGQPMILMLLILVAFFSHVWICYKKRKRLSRVWEFSFLILTGLAGVIIFYISFFSEHPHVFPNYNLWVLNPLNLLIALPFSLIKRLNNWAYRYHFANFVSQLLFILLLYFLPQEFNVVIYLLALALTMLSLVRIIEQNRLKK